jgi:hypothetical protein
MRTMVLALSLSLLLWASGCAGLSESGPPARLSAGQTESDLLARWGQPQEILPGDDGGQTYIYITHRLEPVAGMGGGAWSQPEETHYHISPAGVITEVTPYPYGKRRFIFASKERPVERAAPREPVELAAPSSQPPAPAVAAAAPAPVAAVRQDMAVATRLELNLSQAEVLRLLGSPARTEGFFAEGKPLVVWFYNFADDQGRPVSTPLVFHEGRLRGWGERYYRGLAPEKAP